MSPNVKAWFQGGSRGLRGPWRLFWAGLAVRLLYITLARTFHIRLFQDHFQFGWEVGRIARALATGYGFADPFTGHTGPTAWIGPVYPLLLAGVFKVFGVYTPASAWVILAVNSVFSASIALAVYEIAARCFDAVHSTRQRSVALWSGWLWALYPAAIQYAVHWVWDMSLVACLFAWILVIALRVRGIGEDTSPRPGSPAQWACFGLFWGLLCLSNSTLLLFLPVCGVWMLLRLFRTRPSIPATPSATPPDAADIPDAPQSPRLPPGRGLAPAARNVLLSAFVFLACITPWVWRNWQVFHAFIPTRGNLGAELYASELPEHQGFPWGTTIPFVERDPEYMRYRQLGEPAYVREKAAMAAERRRTHRRQIAGWTLKRFYFFWVSVPHPIEKGFFLEFVRELSFCFLSLGGLFGLALALRRRIPAAGLFAWAFVLLPMTYYLITVQARFRHPLEPLICILTVFLFQSAEPARIAAPTPRGVHPPTEGTG